MTEPTEDLGAPTGRDTAPDRAGLGTPIAVFQPPLRGRVVIAACGIVMLLCGGLIALYPSSDRLSYRVGLQLLVVGGVALFLAYFLGRYRLLICPGGVVCNRGRAQKCYRWDEISEIVVGVLTKLPRGLGFKTTYRRCSLVKRDGSRVDLLGINVGQFEAMVDTLRQLSEPQGIPWKEEVAKPDRVNEWIGRGLRWVIYGWIGLAVLLLIVAGVALRWFW